MKKRFPLGGGVRLGGVLGRLNIGGVAVLFVVSSINPFTATATAPSGFVFVPSNFSLNIPLKPGSFGVDQSVTLSITSAGAITESPAGTVEAAIQAAGYGAGDSVPMAGSGVDTVEYVPPAGMTIFSRTVDRAGVNGTSTTTITHPNLAITQAATQLIALEVYRGIGGISGSSFTIDGVTATEFASPRTIQTTNRAHLRGITNASGDALATVAMTGLTSSTSASGICVLFSVDGANTYTLTHVEAATGATSLSGTISVVAGDLLVLVPFATTSNFVGLTYTGAGEVSAPAQNGNVSAFSGVAVQTISATNAAYSYGINWTSGANNPALIAAIIRHV